MKEPLEFFKEQCIKFAHRFVPYEFKCDDSNMTCFRSCSAFMSWFAQPPGPEGFPCRDRLFYIREISRVSQEIAPDSILEIGTFIGAGTLVLRVLNPSARIVVVDNQTHVNAADGKVYPVGFVATLNNCGHTQLIMDSADLTPEPYQMVFVDGNHDYGPVVKDSAIAVECVKAKGSGAIVWHDYAPGTPGVIQAVDECCASNGLTLQTLPDSGTVWTYL